MPLLSKDLLNPFARYRKETAEWSTPLASVTLAEGFNSQEWEIYIHTYIHIYGEKFYLSPIWKVLFKSNWKVLNF